MTAAPTPFQHLPPTQNNILADLQRPAAEQWPQCPFEPKTQILTPCSICKPLDAVADFRECNRAEMEKIGRLSGDEGLNPSVGPRPA